MLLCCSWTAVSFLAVAKLAEFMVNIIKRTLRKSPGDHREHGIHSFLRCTAENKHIGQSNSFYFNILYNRAELVTAFRCCMSFYLVETIHIFIELLITSCNSDLMVVMTKTLAAFAVKCS